MISSVRGIPNWNKQQRDKQSWKGMEDLKNERGEVLVTGFLSSLSPSRKQQKRYLKLVLVSGKRLSNSKHSEFTSCLG